MIQDLKLETLSVSLDIWPRFSIVTWTKFICMFVMAVLSCVFFYPLIPLAPFTILIVFFIVFFPFNEKSKEQIFRGFDGNPINSVVEFIVLQFVLYVSLYVLRNIYFLWGLEAEVSLLEISIYLRELSVFDIDIKRLQGVLPNGQPGRGANSYLTYSYFCFFTPFLYVLLRPGKFLAGIWISGIFIGGLVFAIKINTDYPRKNRKIKFALILIKITVFYFTYIYYYQTLSIDFKDQHIYTSFLYPYFINYGFILGAIAWFVCCVSTGWSVGWWVMLEIKSLEKTHSLMEALNEFRKLAPWDTEELRKKGTINNG